MFFCNRDYEPQAIQRDRQVADLLLKHDIQLKDYKDQVIFEKNDILKNDLSPYTVFTPYSKKWKENLKHIETFPTNWDHFEHYKGASEIISLKEIGFEKTDLEYAEPELNKKIIDSYGSYRDFPSMDRTTHLGIALRFGTISIRKCVQYAVKHNETWLNELIWREFLCRFSITFQMLFIIALKRNMRILHGETTKRNSRPGVKENRISHCRCRNEATE